jgi:hypothetical protein
MSTDKVTSIVGVTAGVCHQLGLVGVLPVTRQDWLNTVGSVMLGVLGYYINKH